MDPTLFSDPAAMGSLPALAVAATAAASSAAVVRRALRVALAVVVALAGTGFGQLASSADRSVLPEAVHPLLDHGDTVALVSLILAGLLLWRAFRKR